MADRTAYCPACDRDVPVVSRKRARAPDAARLKASGAFVCLDYQVRCTGAMCPLRAVPRTSEDLNLHRQGLLRLRHTDRYRPSRRRSEGEPAVGETVERPVPGPPGQSPERESS